MELEIKHTPVYTWNEEALANPYKRFVINRGGSRSSKTYSLCQLLIVYALTNKKKTISIVRKSFPALRASVMRDFFDVLEDMDLYDERYHNKGESIYTFPSGSRVEFFSVDDSQKLRGRKRNILWCNEANELSYEEFTQLNLRTTEKLFFDFNPSDNHHWLYQLEEDDKAITIKSTYKDNTFLDPLIVEQIENLINIDIENYKVYALGERANVKETIYTHYTQGEYVSTDTRIIGLDIGFNHPTAAVEISVSGDTIWCKELVYASNLTTNDLIQVMDDIQVSKSLPMLVDSARPDYIEDLKRKGYKARGANKSVKEGINAVKSYKVIVDPSSINLIKEFNNYKWKTSGDIVLDEPVKLWDDALDALRYAVYHHHLNVGKGQGFTYKFSSFNF